MKSAKKMVKKIEKSMIPGYYLGILDELSDGDKFIWQRCTYKKLNTVDDIVFANIISDEFGSYSRYNDDSISSAKYRFSKNLIVHVKNSN